MDDFIFQGDSHQAPLLLRALAVFLFTRIGLLRNTMKGIRTPTQIGDHLGLTIDRKLDEFRAQSDKLHTLYKQASVLLGRATSNARWLPARELTTFAGRMQFFYFTIASARFSLRELHSVLATRNG
jgi:hypothetical protein